MEHASFERWAPVCTMLVVSLSFGIGNGLVEKSLGNGLNGMLLVTLRQLIAAAFLAPIAYFKERKSRPKLTRGIFCCIFVNALIGGSLAQYLFYVGLQYTSAIFACAFLNLMPVLTFLIAVLFRLEKVNLRKIVGKAKVAASAVCIAGVLVLICYRGAELTHTHSTDLYARHPAEATGNGGDKTGKWIVGSSLLLACCLCWTAWFLIQSKISSRYPAIYTSNTLMFVLGFFQAAALTLATQRSIPLSTLRGRIEIITVVYSGLVSSAFGFLAMTWCVAKRGPVFPSVFTPLVQMFAGIIDFSILHQPVYFGSVLGSILVIFGLYLLLWAKTKETENVEVKPVEETKEEKEAGNNDDNDARKLPPV